MKKVILILLFFVVVTTSLFGENGIQYPRSLQKPIERMLSFPKAKETLHQVHQQLGLIHVKLEPVSISTQNALWHPKSRSIVLNSKRKRNEGETIRAILFELHNAKNQYKFDYFNKLAKSGRMGREEYIRAIEYAEYENVLATLDILNDAIAQGYYPSSARWNMHTNFEDHYALQKRAGHSQFIGEMYDRMVS